MDGTERRCRGYQLHLGGNGVGFGNTSRAAAAEAAHRGSTPFFRTLLPERSQHPDRNPVFATVSEGSKKRMELARGIEPPTA